MTNVLILVGFVTLFSFWEWESIREDNLRKECMTMRGDWKNGNCRFGEEK